MIMEDQLPRVVPGPQPPFTTIVGSILHHYHRQGLRIEPDAHHKLKTGHEGTVQVP